MSGKMVTLLTGIVENTSTNSAQDIAVDQSSGAQRGVQTSLWHLGLDLMRMYIYSRTSPL